MARKPTPKDLEQLGDLLRHMLAVLSGDIESLELDALGNASATNKATLDEGDAFSQEFSLELLARDEDTVMEVMDALDRIKEGVYGRCEGCENWIPKERLKALPHTRNCVECQRAMEASN